MKKLFCILVLLLSTLGLSARGVDIMKANHREIYDCLLRNLGDESIIYAETHDFFQGVKKQYYTLDEFSWIRFYDCTSQDYFMVYDFVYNYESIQRYKLYLFVPQGRTIEDVIMSGDYKKYFFNGIQLLDEGELKHLDLDSLYKFEVINCDGIKQLARYIKHLK